MKGKEKGKGEKEKKAFRTAANLKKHLWLRSLS